MPGPHKRAARTHSTGDAMLSPWPRWRRWIRRCSAGFTRSTQFRPPLDRSSQDGIAHAAGDGIGVCLVANSRRRYDCAKNFVKNCGSTFELIQ